MGAITSETTGMTTVARTIVTSSHRVWDDTDATTKTRLADLSSDAIEGYLRYRLRQRAKWETGDRGKGSAQASTVH